MLILKKDFQTTYDEEVIRKAHQIHDFGRSLEKFSTENTMGKIGIKVGENEREIQIFVLKGLHYKLVARGCLYCPTCSECDIGHFDQCVH